MSKYFSTQAVDKSVQNFAIAPRKLVIYLTNPLCLFFNQLILLLYFNILHVLSRALI